MQRIKRDLRNDTYCYTQFFKDTEIEQMVNDGIVLKETISPMQLHELSHYQGTDRELYAVTYELEGQNMVYL